jgi:hypothetical protein
VTVGRRMAMAGPLAVLLSAITGAGCKESTVATGGPSEGGVALDAGECRGPGRYEAGKEGSYRPCCAGLTEVPYLKPAYEGPGLVPVCTSFPLRVYACVRGTCGDGICEEGEAPACGCVADCPSARFGTPDAAATDVATLDATATEVATLDATDGGLACNSVAQEATDFVLESGQCQAGDVCQPVIWETLIGRPTCTLAMACWALVPARRAGADLAARARALAERSEACGVCGTARCAAAPDHAVCDLSRGRCVPTAPGDAGRD